MPKVAELSVKDLTVHRGGKPVVHGANMVFRPGEITAMIGANGAGKSSSVMAIAGAIKSEQGQVRLGDLDLSGLAADRIRRHGVALVPEGHPVLGDLTVLDNLRAAASFMSLRDSIANIDRALALFPELSARLDVPASALSGGQKQMVLIGQAIIANPQFLLIDELSLGLAPTIVNRLANTLEQLAADGTGIVLIEQFTTLALRLAKRAYVLDRGRIIFDGASAELRENPDILHSAYLG